MMSVMPTDINWILKLGLQVCSASSGHSVDPVRLWQAANPGNVASNPAGRWAQGVDLHPDDQDAGRAGVLPQLPWLCVHAACKYYLFLYLIYMKIFQDGSTRVEMRQCLMER